MPNPQNHHRRSIRLNGYDYAQSGAYFITICTYQKECLFGTVCNSEMVLNELGNIVQTEWLKSAEIRKEIEIGEFVVMPNHMHGIVIITRRGDWSVGENDNDFNPGVGAYGHTPLPRNGTPIHHNQTTQNEKIFRSPSETIGAMVRGFKSCATIRINQIRNTPRVPVWQRNYYEHIIRDEEDYLRILTYIQNNPILWMEDKLYMNDGLNLSNQNREP